MQALRRATLSARLLGLLLPGMAVVLAASLWLTRAEATQAANAAYDRSLLGAIKGLDLNVSTASGGLAVEQPYRLFEFFQLAGSAQVLWRVTTDDGLVEIGSPDLPAPPGRPRRAPGGARAPRASTTPSTSASRCGSARCGARWRRRSATRRTS